MVEGRESIIPRELAEGLDGEHDDETAADE